MATKRNVDEMVKRDVETRNLVTKEAEKTVSADDLIAHTFMISGRDLGELKTWAKREGVSINAAARMAIKRLLRNN